MKPCGTRAAYRRHLALGEEPCAECVAAKSVRDAECPVCEDVGFMVDTSAPGSEIPVRIGMSRDDLISHLVEHRRAHLAAKVADVPTYGDYLDSRHEAADWDTLEAPTYIDPDLWSDN